MPYAFRCNTCGHLETSDAAGENDTPSKCRVCGAGASFDPQTGLPKRDPANWTVLADLEPKELEALGVDAVEAHTPFTRDGNPEATESVSRRPQALKRDAEDGTAAVDDVR